MTVSKVILSEAVQIRTPEDEKIVRKWLGDWRPGQLGHEADLEALKEARVYFLRDEGSPIVYICTEEEFKNNFKEVDNSFKF